LAGHATPALLLVLLCLPATAPAASYAGRPTRQGGLTLSAAVRGDRVAFATGHGFAGRFWPGVNLGATVPGTQPGELAATRAEYDRWLRGIGALGARVVRVYTILRPAFYDALAAYDRRHPGAPLRFIQGVWVPEERLDATGDAYDPEVTSGFEAEMADAVAVVHGRAHIPARPGHASGRYRSDVSRWLLAWSPGIEWDPTAAQSTDARHAGTAPYQGRYITATPAATPMESWLAARLDHLASLEAARGWSRPVTFTNWVTDDPLSHPDEPLPTEDLVSVDAMHLRATPAWPGGFFASYHAYPYYPDFLGLQADLRSAADPYAAYLRDLRAHHAGQAVMITEFGVPSGLGDAHRGPLGRDQGNHSETEQGAMDAAMLRDIRAQGFAGGIVFEYLDEWFKRSWNTEPIAQPVDRRPLWKNVLTNEAQFGLVAAEPGARPKVVLDGRAREWRRVPALLRSSGPVRELRATSDAGYLYLLVRRRGPAAFQVGFDVRPSGSDGLPGRPGVDPAADVALSVGARSARLDWAAAADSFPSTWPYFAADGDWAPPRLLLTRPETVPSSGQPLPAQALDLSRLRWGRAPEAGGTDDRVLAAGRESLVELRIPWGLLTYADPSSHLVAVPHPDGTVTTLRTGAIGLAVAAAGRPVQAAKPYRFAGWNRVRWHERRKAGWRALARAMAATGR
jgi:hypothetical protein